MFKNRRNVLALAVIALLLGPLGFLACATHLSGPNLARDLPPHPSNLQRGARLYAQHCTLCHGYRGSGDGPVASYLEPSPRDFTTGTFSLVSTDNAIPTDEDLLQVLRRGMPGSAMPSWSWMPEADLEQIARYVRHLAVAGLAQKAQSFAELRGTPMSAAEAERAAKLAMTPGQVLNPGQPFTATAEILSAGKALYGEHCAACHGKDGTGRRPVPKWPEQSSFAWTRDFTKGILRGGATYQDLGWRIQAGMPASGMPPTDLDSAQLGALTTYVHTLIPKGAGARLVRTRRTIHVKRVSGALPEDGDDPRWQSTRVALAPLSWNDRAVLEAEVAMLHDGDSIAVRIRWRDNTRDDRPGVGLGFADGLAVQFSDAKEPPLLAMGDEQNPVNIWHWSPFRRKDTAGVLDLMENPPHSLRDPRTGQPLRTDATIYRPAPQDPKKATAARGKGLVHTDEILQTGVEIRAVPRWRDGVWQVIFRRPLRPTSDKEIRFRPGRQIHFACAIWDGSTQTRSGQKSITVWHLLRID